jgi:hypothetical protein
LLVDGELEGHGASSLGLEGRVVLTLRLCDWEWAFARDGGGSRMVSLETLPS